MKRLHRIYLKHDKHTENMQTIPIALPASVSISMAQTMGAPCEPLVAPGDKVLVGQKIGDSEGFLSAPVHSSVSGTVLGISDYLMANGRVCKTVVIETDGLQTLDPGLKLPTLTDKDSYVKAVRESGACGLGGAGFPTHVKLAYDSAATPIDTLVVNGAECEPYITSDYREIVEHPEDIYEGIRELMWYCKIPSAVLCIENNKPSAIAKMRELAEGNPAIKVLELPSAYPQGAEKMIVYSATGRILGEGELPSAQKILVMNVSTIAFLYRYMHSGKPLVSRRLTVDGTAITKPCNLEVPLGVSVAELLAFAEVEGEVAKLIAGGPMMGTCIYDNAAPVVKTYNALLAMAPEAPPPAPSPCIRCGRCISACPMELMPTELEQAFHYGDLEALKALKVGLCMNCGSCTYVCPAKRPLAESHQLARAMLAKETANKGKG